jgi:hypothetical protein
MEMERLTLNIDQPLRTKLKAAATAAGVSEKDMAHQAVAAGLDTIETTAGRTKGSLFDALRSLGPVEIKGR